MSVKPRVRVLCLPDIDRAIGGVKQLYRHVEHLVALGWDAAIVTQEEGFRPSWFDSSAPSLSLHRCKSSNEFNPDETVLLLPETYLDADLRSFHGYDLSHLSRVIFNQNAYYSYGNYSGDTTTKLSNFYDHQSVLQVLSVSEDTHVFLATNIGLNDNHLSRIVNSIEPIFECDKLKTDRLHWMPRKNSQHVQAVIQGLRRSNLPYSGNWHGEPLRDLSHAQVAERLNGARLFLSFGHPEDLVCRLLRRWLQAVGLLVTAEVVAVNFFVLVPVMRSASGIGQDLLLPCGMSSSVLQNHQETELRLQRQHMPFVLFTA